MYYLMFMNWETRVSNFPMLNFQEKFKNQEKV